MHVCLCGCARARAWKRILSSQQRTGEWKSSLITVLSRCSPWSPEAKPRDTGLTSYLNLMAG